MSFLLELFSSSFCPFFSPSILSLRLSQPLGLVLFYFYFSYNLFKFLLKRPLLLSTPYPSGTGRYTGTWH